METDDTYEGNIFLIDDDPRNIEALECVLSPLNQNLVTAGSGGDALRLLLDQDFIVVLLDIRLPDMSGFEVAEAIRKRERSQSTPIILMTAYDVDDLHIIRGYNIGAIDYLFKPLIPEILLAKISFFVELYHKTEQIKRKEQQIHMLEQIKKQDRVIDQLQKFGYSSQTKVTTESFGLLPIQKGYPEEFEKFVKEYTRLIELALEMRTYKVEHDISEKLRQLVRRLGSLRAVPRDVIDVHLAGMQGVTAGANPQKVLGYMEEARIMVLELMGHLVSFYRSHSILNYMDLADGEM